LGHSFIFRKTKRKYEKKAFLAVGVGPWRTKKGRKNLFSYTCLLYTLSLSLSVFSDFLAAPSSGLLSLTPTCSSEKPENISSFLEKERHF
jgi:hypothetical protein